MPGHNPGWNDCHVYGWALHASVLSTDELVCRDLAAFNEKITIDYEITNIRLVAIILGYAWISWSDHGKPGDDMPWHMQRWPAESNANASTGCP